MLQQLTSYLSTNTQQRLKSAKFAVEIMTGYFTSPEPEFRMLREWVNFGDTVIDIGANVGHYTCALSRLVGRDGLVIAVEPMLQTFSLLRKNVERLPFNNVHLIMAAASDVEETLYMDVPKNNFYRAEIRRHGKHKVLAEPIDVFTVNKHVKLIKIDVEGHELKALRGLSVTIERCRPVLIVENNDPEVKTWLMQRGYRWVRYVNSPNLVYLP